MLYNNQSFVRTQFVINFILNERKIICLLSSFAIIFTQKNSLHSCVLTLIIRFNIICMQTVKLLPVLLFNTNYYIEYFIHLHTVKWYKVWVCITNISIKHQLSDQTVLFLTIQLGIRHLFSQSLNVKQFYLIHTYDPIRVDLGVMTIKRYSIFPQSIRTGALSSDDFLVKNQTLVAEMQSVYSTGPAEWATNRICCDETR